MADEVHVRGQHPTLARLTGDSNHKGEGPGRCIDVHACKFILLAKLIQLVTDTFEFVVLNDVLLRFKVLTALLADNVLALRQ